jgi:hypothetical protein
MPYMIFTTHPIEKPYLIYQIGSADPDLAAQAAKTVMQDVSGIDLRCEALVERLNSKIDSGRRYNRKKIPRRRIRKTVYSDPQKISEAAQSTCMNANVTLTVFMPVFLCFRLGEKELQDDNRRTYSQPSP